MKIVGTAAAFILMLRKNVKVAEEARFRKKLKKLVYDTVGEDGKTVSEGTSVSTF